MLVTEDESGAKLSCSGFDCSQTAEVRKPWAMRNPLDLASRNVMAMDPNFRFAMGRAYLAAKSLKRANSSYSNTILGGPILGVMKFLTSSLGNPQKVVRFLSMFKNEVKALAPNHPCRSQLMNFGQILTRLTVISDQAIIPQDLTMADDDQHEIPNKLITELEPGDPFHLGPLLTHWSCLPRK